jgi:hypothetical protein
MSGGVWPRSQAGRVIIEGVDPRDIEWEVDQPVYRVYFWHRPPAQLGIPQERMGYHCQGDRLRDAADVYEVLDWAGRTARAEQTFTLYVEHLESGSLGLIHLFGRDPTVAE